MDEQSIEKEKTGSADHLGKSAIWMFGAIVLGRIFGFVRESALAFVYGVSPQVDAFIVAQTITFMLFSFLGPAIWNAGIPVLSALFAKDMSRQRQQYRGIVWSFFHIIILITGSIMVIGYFITPFLVHLVAPGFDDAREASAILLTRAMLPVILFFGLSGWASLVLQSQNRFGTYSLSYLPNNLIAIVGIFLSAFTGSMELVAVSFMLGIAGQLIVQIPGVLKTRYKLSLDLKNSEFIKIIKLAPSTILTELGNQINALVDRMFGSGLVAGSIASLGYGQRTFNLVTGVIQMPIIIVLFPKLSAHNGLGDDKNFVKLLGKGLSMLAFLMIPSAAGLMVLSIPITQLLFERGAFNSSATIVTASIVFFYAIGLPFLSWRDLLIRSFYAMKNAKTPVISALIMVGTNMGLNFIIVPIYGVKALAISTSFGAMVSTIICYLIIRHKFRMHLVQMSVFYQSLIKSVMATAGMITVVYFIAAAMGVHIWTRAEMSHSRLAVSLAVIIFCAAISYVLFSLILKSKENGHCFKIAASFTGKLITNWKTRKAKTIHVQFRGGLERDEQ